MTSLLDLAERCEAATGPDRELDALIAVAAHKYPVVNETWMGGSIKPFDPDKWIAKSNGYLEHPDWQYDRGPGMSKSLRYTASLDAAMTLVPEGWFVRLDDLGADGLPLAILHAPDEPSHVGIGRDLTLSLCAAALRARANHQGNAEGENS